MSYLALYRKYRPKNFSDLIGQSEVVNIIKNEILNDKISHAYLFSGPRGTGKTSTAKIIAKMINCSDLNSDGVPCGQCVSCINFSSSSDIIEIDAASNNGVDEIRDLRDKVNLVPTFGRYKIYIIDEVHMLTVQAFNALLKTLEEPPSHIVFILATTEYYKIPLTVVSRCQKFQFLKFSSDDIVSKLSEIAEEEHISVDKSILYEIARLSDGGMRDAINMLDQLSSFSDGDLKIEDLYNLNGVISFDEISDFLIAIRNSDVNFIVQFVEKLNYSGKNFEQFLNDFISLVKDLLIYMNNGTIELNFMNANDIFDKLSGLLKIEDLYLIISTLNDLVVKIHNSTFSKILLITDFIKLSHCLGKDSLSINKTLVVNDDVINNSLKKDCKINNKISKISDREKMIRVNNAFATASKKLKSEFIDNWGMIQEKLSDDLYLSVAGMINDIDVMVVGEGYVIFVAQYDSLIDRLFEQIDIIEKLLFDVYDCHYKVVFLMNDEWKHEKDKFIDAVKSGKQYVLIIENDNGMKNESVGGEDVDVEKIVSIFGNDIISYE